MLRKWLKLNNTIELLNITTYKHKRNMKKYLLFTIIILCNLMVQAQKIEAVDETEGTAFTLCPNPASGVLRIEGVEADEVWFYNALGQLVKTVRGTNEIDLSGLVDGVYLLRISDAEGKVYTNKITVQ